MPGVGGGASGAAASRCPTARGRGPEPGFPVNSELRSLQDREVHPRPTRASHVIEVFQNIRGCSTCRLVSPRALADPRVCVWSALARGPRRYRCHHRKHLVTRTFGSEGYSQRSCPHAHSDAVCRRSEQRTGEEQRCLWMQETTARTPTLSGEGQGTVGRGQLGGKSRMRGARGAAFPLRLDLLPPARWLCLAGTLSPWDSPTADTRGAGCVENPCPGASSVFGDCGSSRGFLSCCAPW